MAVRNLIFPRLWAMDPNDQKRVRRKDYTTKQNGDASISTVNDELDPWTAWAYKPHTITFLFVGACFLM